MTKTLAYYNMTKITDVKNFIAQAPGGPVKGPTLIYIIGMIFWKTENVFEFNLNLINNFEFHQALCANVSINEPRLMKLVP